MKLAALVHDLGEMRLLGDADVEVRAVQDDSRRVEPGDVFVAMRGRRSDGRAFVAQAVARGAHALVLEAPIPEAELSAPVTQVIVPHAAEALGVLAARQAGRPGERMGLIGITGTNGKTTCAYLVEAMLRGAGRSPGVIGTVSYRYGDRVVPAPYTTPTPLVLHRVLADMVAAGCTHAVLEASSAALEMDRLSGVEFAVAAFTNLSQDHLDLHGSMDAYRAAKERLFRAHLAPDGVAVIDVDDPAGAAMIAAAGGRRVLTVSARGRHDADVRVVEADTSIAGIQATLATPRGPLRLTSPVLLGAYNVANLALTAAIGEALGLDHDAVAAGIAHMPGVPGRVERVPNQAELDILVDYAHTPDALRNVLAALRPLTRRRLICVFGCGGDRDADKRPKMGAAVADLADLAVVTSDNPRSEDPQAIIDQILPGVPTPFFVHPDRGVAITAAVCEATPGDVVLIAGKGHETYQLVGAETLHFDDREEAARAAGLRWRFPLAELAEACGGTLSPPPGTAGTADTAGTSCTRVVIDGRQAAPGDLYVAIRGHRFDGHDFCLQAVRAGAAGLLVARGFDPRARGFGDDDLAGLAVIEVDDPRAALAAVARWHRRRWAEAPPFPGSDRARVDKPVVGVTGSAGKTTTKGLIAAALSPRHCVHATPGSFNNETGVPLTLLGLMPYHDAAVVEMGMRGLGQIDYLVGIAEPSVAAVINAGTAHLGVLGSADAIAQGKGEIFGRLDQVPGGGVAVYPIDDDRLAEYARTAPRRLSFGAAAGHPEPGQPRPEVCVIGYAPAVVELGADTGRPGAALTIAVRIPAAAPSGDEPVQVDERSAVTIALVGRHNAANAACAVACAVAAGVPAEQAIAGLARARPPAMRGQIRTVAGRQVLIDCYNANPASMAAALATVDELARTRGARALAVLGDMLELGDEAPAAHREVARDAAARGIEIIALGAHGPDLAGPDGPCFDDPEAAADQALARTRAGDWILVKASRGMRLERVVTAMERLADAGIEPSPREA
ncbi:bifunctional UDP-N-acetylmuramoyl-L-alanyl-D-glutamate--2,6-diaminopimelate ligase MurE/UDP-N-acetylmuramoyl-tripeptide--D-alanyl-D-alanine ligase MurF [Haliangium sp.]|uniref:bifunctional UDP-N-acetylmuramoyl-L-alanyl-D-glutamate--2, 6-diaminopimelate ligase MurE/UDP-N-acetylmuramoyl-tripeptide--D-alanyl-D-alanine ligase MurF n=1 Tax=Haliangium sp. TaxID=2663208 RepID=UPI003D0FF7ED